MWIINFYLEFFLLFPFHLYTIKLISIFLFAPLRAHGRAIWKDRGKNTTARTRSPAPRSQHIMRINVKIYFILHLLYYLLANESIWWGWCVRVVAGSFVLKFYCNLNAENKLATRDRRYAIKFTQWQLSLWSLICFIFIIVYTIYIYIHTITSRRSVDAVPYMRSFFIWPFFSSHCVVRAVQQLAMIVKYGYSFLVAYRCRKVTKMPTP